MLLFFFFFNDTATTEIYTLSLHDALPISLEVQVVAGLVQDQYRGVAQEQLGQGQLAQLAGRQADRKSTRLNSSHLVISYAVFCLKKKKIEFNSLRISAIYYESNEMSVADAADYM